MPDIKVVAVSDIHQRDVETPQGDLLIVAGDYSFRGTLKEINWFVEWLKEQPQRLKVYVNGNHELGLEDNPWLNQEIMERTGAHYLENSSIDIEGIKVWGSPVTPMFCNWAYMQERGEEIARVWSQIPANVDILITHGPPMGILDPVPGYLTRSGKEERVGCEELLKTVKEVKPKVHIFGHLHSGYGVLLEEDTLYINAASVNEMYEPINPPITFTINTETKEVKLC